jgi:hypothetical protein
MQQAISVMNEFQFILHPQRPQSFLKLLTGRQTKDNSLIGSDQETARLIMD